MDFGSILVYVTSYFGLFTASFFILTLFENKHKLSSPEPTFFPTVTICVPAYNEEKTLAKTVESLLNMNYPKDKLKIYVVNDGSKDRTLEIAKQFEKYGVKVIDKKNSGKADSLNTIIKMCDTEFFGALDADSFADENSIRRMIGFFADPSVMAVTPSMMVYNPKGILQKVQHIEFLFGIFLRKVFSYLGSIHVTPGPLSIFRKSFFDKHGGYVLNNLTEDIEVALRIQSLGYNIENSLDAYVYTVAFNKFKPLFNQRKRWYTGFLQNVHKYKSLFSLKHGNLGLIVLPSSFVSIVLVIISLGYVFYNLIIKGIVKNYLNLKAINFEFWTLFNNIKFDFFYFNITSLFFISIASLFISISLIYIAKRLAKREKGIALSYVYFALTYWFLYGIWWIASGFAILTNKKQKWGDQEI